MYDYVIVGAGSAGCVLAARLSEDPDVTVALLEAGPPDTAHEIHIPLAFGALLQVRAATGTSPASPSRGSTAGASTCRAAKMLGGSSSINAMIYIRGNRADYDEWAAMGADGLGLRRRAALLQALRGQRARRGRRSTASAARSPRPREPLDEPGRSTRWIEAARAGGPRAQPGLQRRRARRASAASRSPSATGVRCSTVGALPAPGRWSAAEPRRDHRRAGAADPLRGRSRGRRRGHRAAARSRRSAPSAR